MLISYKKEDDSKIINFIRNKVLKTFQRKKSFLYFLLLFNIGILLTAPLDYGRRNSDFIHRARKAFSVLLGEIDQRYKLINDEVYLYGGNFLGIGERYISSFFNNVDAINLNLNFKNYEKLKFLRNKALEDGVLIRSENDEASGYLTYKGKNYPIKIRLKGDWTDHLLGDKWSFRVQTKKNTALLGMENFSLQHPRTRNYINEFVYHKLLEYEELPFLRYRFLPLYLNGKYLGIYALEEHFDKHLLENSGYREGPIIKISDKDLRNNYFQINSLVKDNGLYKIKNFIDSDLNNAEINTFNTNKLIKTDSKVSQYFLAESLLNKFLAKELKTSEVFDIEKTAKFFAISELVQALPSWYDIRFYFDPLKGRLVPIGYDAVPDIRVTNRKLTIDTNPLNIFDDPEFTKAYYSNLEKLVSKDYLNKFLNEISKDINKELNTINKSFPHVRFLRNEFERNKNYIISRINTTEPIQIRKHSALDINNPFLQVLNKTYFPIEVLKLQYKNKIYVPSSRKTLKGRDKFRRISSNIIYFKPEIKKNKIENINTENYLVTYRYYGGSKVNNLNLKKFPDIDYTLYSDALIKKESNLEDFPFLIEDKKNKSVILNKNLIVDKPLIIPKGYKFIIKKGLEISLIKEGMIIIQGPLIINGEANYPVIFNSFEGGKGIFVSESNQTSKINYAIFNKLKSPFKKSLNITGGVSFYNTSVSILNSKFMNSDSEDSLNLISSSFIIKDSVFNTTASDAIDADFSNGEIYNTEFNKVGNDAIDISGGKVYLNNILVNEAGDKAVSSGEKSEVIINDINISNSFIGIASKDSSKVQINNMQTKDVKYCLAVYQKKQEYGPSFIDIGKIDRICRVNYIQEKGSTINSKQYRFVPNIIDAFSKLYEETTNDK